MFEKLKAALRRGSSPPEFALYDSTEVNQLPKGRGDWAVAGYLQGAVVDATWPDVQRLYPAHRKFSICVTAGQQGRCLDIENGDARIFDAPRWLRNRAEGPVPILYIQLSNAQRLVNYLAQHGVKRSRYKLWVAHYTGVAHRCTSRCGLEFRDEADATQWTENGYGRNLDISLCRGDFLTPPPKPHPAPAPTPKPKPPKPSPHPFPTEPQYVYVLKPGKHDTAGNHHGVSCVQIALGVKPVDGKYGPKTVTAVKKFQDAHKLAVTGNVDKKTWTAIFHKPLIQSVPQRKV